MQHSDAFLPDAPALAQALRTALPHFTHVDWKAETSSTNLDVLALARNPQRARPYLQGAHVQTQGRGRAGRVWQNQPGTCLMFSCAFDATLVPTALPLLSPLAGMAACLALRALLPPALQADITVKWPNDVLWRGAKLAGILVETRRAPAAHGHIVVIGIGINIHGAAALSLALGRDVADWSHVVQGDARAGAIAAQHLVEKIARQWQAAVHHVHTRGTDDFPQHYARVDALAGQAVHILDQGAVTLSGRACGVNPHGQLLVRTDNGKVCPVAVGEVSVRTP